MTAEKKVKETAIRHEMRKPSKERVIVFLYSLRFFFGVLAKCPIQRTRKIYERKRKLSRPETNSHVIPTDSCM